MVMRGPPAVAKTAARTVELLTAPARPVARWLELGARRVLEADRREAWVEPRVPLGGQVREARAAAVARLAEGPVAPSLAPVVGWPAALAGALEAGWAAVSELAGPEPVGRALAAQAPVVAPTVVQGQAVAVRRERRVAGWGERSWSELAG